LIALTNSTQFLIHFDRLAEAPNAIPRLRRFILDLAVRGKLVDQDPHDEPAYALLERIRAEKARLIDTGEGRKERSLPLTPADEIPFKIPDNWLWSQLAEVGFLSPRNRGDDDLQASFVPMASISAEYGAPIEVEMRPWGEIKSGYTHFAEGDVAVAKITPCFENGKSTVFRGLQGGIGAGTTELHVVRPVLIEPNYILVLLKSPYFIENGTPRMTGTAGQKRLPIEYFAHAPFPLPPVAEQRRIVDKVDELMVLCDRLETAQRERESRRDRLAVASLKRLNQPTISGRTEDFREHARFYLAHLPRLTARPDRIPALRQTILNLAVRGKLVSRDLSDELPSELLRAKENPSGGFDSRVFSEALAAINVPSHWLVEPLAKVALSIVDCPHSTPQWTREGRICVRTNQFRPGFLDLSEARFVSEATYRERIERLEPIEDDILYSREGGILGVACRVPPNTQLCLGQRMMLIRSGAATEAAFLEMVLNSPMITEIARQKTTGGAAPRVNVATIKAYPIPIPPLPEQRRILAKVSELMDVCDRLERQLTSAQDESRRLLEAVLHEALDRAG
jgi:type I restriction enzyme, S subunit